MGKRWSSKKWGLFAFMGLKKKAGVSMGTSSALLCITAHTERTDMYFTFRKSMNAHTARLPLEIIELHVFLFLNFTFPNPAVFLCCSLSLCIYNPFLDISQVNLKCRSNSFTYRIYSPFSVTHWAYMCLCSFDLTWDASWSKWDRASFKKPRTCRSCY